MIVLLCVNMWNRWVGGLFLGALLVGCSLPSEHAPPSEGEVEEPSDEDTEPSDEDTEPSDENTELSDENTEPTPTNPQPLSTFDLVGLDPIREPVPASIEPPTTGFYQLHWYDGTLALQGNMRRGQRHGEFTFYDQTGGVIESGRYVQGQPRGRWTSHHVDGSTSVEELRSGYCEELDLEQPPPLPTGFCGTNALMGIASDTHHEQPEAIALRRCFDHHKVWLQAQLDSADREIYAHAVALARASATSQAWDLWVADVRAMLAQLLINTEAMQHFTAMQRIMMDLNVLNLAGDTRLRFDMLDCAEQVRELGLTSVRTNLSVPLLAIARTDPSFAEHYLAAVVRITIAHGPRGFYQLHEATRAYQLALEPDKRITLWGAVIALMREVRERDDLAPGNSDGKAHVELGRAYQSDARTADARDSFGTARDIFTTMQCGLCLEEVDAELAGLPGATQP